MEKIVFSYNIYIIIMYILYTIGILHIINILEFSSKRRLTSLFRVFWCINIIYLSIIFFYLVHFLIIFFHFSILILMIIIQINFSAHLPIYIFLQDLVYCILTTKFTSFLIELLKFSFALSLYPLRRVFLTKVTKDLTFP